MQKILKKYGVIILFYLVVIAGVMLLSFRLKYINSQNTSKIVAIAE